MILRLAELRWEVGVGVRRLALVWIGYTTLVFRACHDEVRAWLGWS